MRTEMFWQEIYIKFISIIMDLPRSMVLLLMKIHDRVDLAICYHFYVSTEYVLSWYDKKIKIIR